MILVHQFLEGDTPDVLAGTQLDQAPQAGTFTIYVASDLEDDRYSISLGGATYVDNQFIPMRANGMPSAFDDIPVVLSSPGGSRPVIAVLETTGPSGIHVIVVFQ